jgi:hypothetical protein
MNTNTNENGITGMYTIHEILSRARMREPQNIPSEASRSARQISIRARKQAARERNGW